MKLYKINLLIRFSLLCFVNGQSEYQGLTSWYGSSTVSFGGGGTLLNIQEADRQNPALLGEIDSQKFMLDIIHYPADVSSKHLGWIIPKNKRVYSVHYRRMDYGQFDGYDEDGNPTGSYSSNDSWLSGTVSSRSEIFSYGTTLGLFYSRLSNSESVVFISTFGGKATFEKINMNIGLTLRNLGTVLKQYSKVNEQIPTSGILSVSKKLKHLPLKLNVDIKVLENTHQQAIFLSGVFTLTPSLYLTWGINSDKFKQRLESGMTKDLITGTGLGIGLKTGKLFIETGSYFYNPGNWIFGFSLSINN